MSLESLPARPVAPRADAETKPVLEPAPKQPSPATLRGFDAALLVGFLALTFLLGVFPLKDTDFWWHLKTGDLIRQTGKVPHADLYTFTVAGQPWIDLHWAFQVFLSVGYSLGGVVALNLAKCVITCTAVFLLITARRREWPVWVMLLAWLPALLVLSGRMYVRPETLSLLFLSAYLAVLVRWDRRPWLAFVLPLVQTAWVNCHGLFVLGPIVLAFGLIDAVLRPASLAPRPRVWWRIVGSATLLTGLACLINPYGLKGALYPLQLARTMGNPIFAQAIAELTPIPDFIRRNGNWDNLPLQLHLATMALGGLSFLVPLFWSAWVHLPRVSPGEAAARTAAKRLPSRSQGAKQARATQRGKRSALSGSVWLPSPLRLLLYIAFSALSLQATRNSHQFAAVVGTVTAWNLGEWASLVRNRREALASNPSAGRPRSVIAPRALTAAVLALVFVFVASGSFYTLAGEGRTIGWGEEPLWYPHRATEFAGRKGMPERFLCFHEGFASLYEYEYAPRRKVFIDARLEVVGPELYGRYLKLRKQISDNVSDWLRQLSELKNPAILAEHIGNSNVGVSLLASPTWRCVWFDPLAAVFLHESALKSAGVTPVDFAARHFRPRPEDEPHGIREILATTKALRNYAQVLQDVHRRGDLALPFVLLGQDHARKVIELDPDGFEGWKALGMLELYREAPIAEPVARYKMTFDPVFDLSPVRATYALRRALKTAPRDFLTPVMLAKSFEERGLHESALPLLEQILRVRTVNWMQVEMQKFAQNKVGELRFKVGSTSLSSSTKPADLERTLNEQLDAGRAESAAQLLERAYPDLPRAWNVCDRLATLYLHLGEPARARLVLQASAEASSPGLRMARVAATYLVEEDFDAARRSYRAALAAEPGLFEARYGLAIVEQDAGRAAEALAEAREALPRAAAGVARSATQAIADLAARYTSKRADE